MNTRQDSFLGFLGREDTRFVIPLYQRVYSWAPRQCQELWTDIMRAGSQQRSHFMSMVLFTQAEEDGLTALDIIDGQQRIATMTVMLTAFRDYLAHSGAVLEGWDPQELQQRYLMAGSGLKLQLLGVDQPTLEALVRGAELPAKASEHVLANYRFYLGKMGEESFDPAVFAAGLRQLLVIDAQLGPQDKAQEIFESLNTKGLPLTTADLVRNYLLVGLPRAEQRRLYDEYWNPITLMFGEDPGAYKLNAGIRMWLSIRSRQTRIHDKSQTYNAFKAYMTQEYQGTVEELLDELRAFCLMWAENYKFNEVKEFRCMKWAKGKSTTLLPQWGHPSGF